ncbi:MAG: ABC transporter substrate-binding protein [Coriobacteriales bacterium]|jgi:iron complex transport system substrate-binding protein|nr:ABC transporter substrate-binding protein [Coriobacteriales bacterium]
MKRKLLSIALAAVMTLALVLAACAAPAPAPAPQGSGSDTEASKSVSVVDMTGRTVTLDKPAEKIVVLTASSCEIVYALGAGDKVVGRGEYCDWPSEALAKPTVQSGTNTNIEQIIALEADLLILTTMAQSPEQAKQLENAGVKVFTTDAVDIKGTYESIEQIGVLLGKETQASTIVNQMKSSFAAVSAQKLSGTVYFEVSPLEYGLWTAGNDTFMNEVAEMMGLENIFADVSGWAQISEEQVLERNPDYIVTIGMYYGEGLKPDEEIASRERWQDVSAVKNGAILNLANSELSRPGPRLADGAQELYSFVSTHAK